MNDLSEFVVLSDTTPCLPMTLINLLSKASTLSRSPTPEDAFNVLDEIKKMVPKDDFLIVESICDSIRVCACFTMDSIAEPKDKWKKGGFVYFIQRPDGKIKIGTAKNVEKRLKQIQVSAGEKLEVVKVTRGGTELEAYLHRLFESSNHFGEWFNPDEPLLKLLENERAILEAEMHPPLFRLATTTA